MIFAHVRGGLRRQQCGAVAPHRRLVHAAAEIRVRDTLSPATLGQNSSCSNSNSNSSGDVTITAWVRTARHQKNVSFLELNDGSCASSLQAVWDTRGASPSDRTFMGTGACVRVRGRVVPSPKPGQAVELQASAVTLLGGCDAATYPLQKKAHSDEFLREIPHLRARAGKASAMLRARHVLSRSLQDALCHDGFISVNTPILTSNDCEGGGELFAVSPAAERSSSSSTHLDGLHRSDTGAAAVSDPRTSAAVDSSMSPKSGSPSSYFGCPSVYLTVSGQLQLEAFACAMGRVYTFGPTFRAENSNTSRHASEFWMLEPEIAPGTMHDAMALAERCVKAACAGLLHDAPEDVAWLARSLDSGLPDRLSQAASPGAFTCMSYSEAINTLHASGHRFAAPVSWSAGLATEHERFLAERVVGGPLFVHDYPASLKPFYMRENDDGESSGGGGGGSEKRTVAAFDLLLPRIGELVGGSAREERWDVLAPKMARLGLLSEETTLRILGKGAASAAKYSEASSALDWYLDTRRFGTVPHAGWGLGFERLVMFATGIDNIRDAIPVPRVPGSCRM